ncbi:hypothetical protein F4811DRAFT_515343 [Daldinia bambusicola]|nr:hypothetical protein F4811DRAFT_515343 [Daldinia bambusicola]
MSISDCGCLRISSRGVLCLIYLGCMLNFVSIVWASSARYKEYPDMRGLPIAGISQLVCVNEGYERHREKKKKTAIFPTIPHPIDICTCISLISSITV